MFSQGSLWRSSSRARHFRILKVNLLSISSRKGISFAGEAQHTSTAPVNSGDNNYKFANGRAGETRKTRSVCLLMRFGRWVVGPESSKPVCKLTEKCTRETQVQEKGFLKTINKVRFWLLAVFVWKVYILWQVLMRIVTASSVYLDSPSPRP